MPKTINILFIIYLISLIFLNNYTLNNTLFIKNMYPINFVFLFI